MSRVRQLHRVWWVLLVAAVVLTSAVDAFLLERTQTFFTAGFNAGHARGLPQVAAFVAAGALLDLWLLVGIGALLLPLFSRLPGTEAQRLVAVWLAALAVPFSIDFVRYRVARVVGALADVEILLDVSAGALRIMLAEAALYAGPLIILLLLAALFASGVVLGVGRLQRRRGWLSDAARPSARSQWRVFAIVSLLAVGALLATASRAPNLYAGLAEKPSGWLVELMIQRATDVDLDGFGVLSRPPDPAPFDGSRNAFAVDIAGNGVDENGLAGDLPTGVRPPPVVALPPHSEAERTPDLLLIYLESFRADLLGRERNGRPVTPFFDALAREGAQSRRAYVHSPYTLWSRAQLFGGAVVPQYGQRTLVDDFAERGYTVALFSGQDDTFGRSKELTGIDRADFVYDARQDADQRTSRSPSPASLQVSATLVRERVNVFLAEFASGGATRPLFLYVNFVDTHFPYTHDRLENLLDVAPLPRDEIRPENAELIRAAYENTAANVDRAARDLVVDFRHALGGRDHAILVVSDHGQGFYERGFLGHGQALTDDQTRTPFIVWGVGGDWPEPLGMADVRGLLQRNLFRAVEPGRERARFVPEPDRRVLHFMARIGSPRMIGLRSLGGLASYDLERGRLELFDAEDRRLEPRPGSEERAFRELVHTWEATRAAPRAD